jgi:sigma-B regulation protein RsbU (phosphoserine phosphatase)
MERAHGASLSVKMIVATTALIVVIVALFGVLSVWNMGRMFDETAKRSEEVTTTALRRRAETAVRTLVPMSRTAIQQNDWITLRDFIPAIGKEDPELAFVYVADKDGLVMAHSQKDRNEKKVNDASWEAIKGAKETVVKNRIRIGANDVLLVGRPITSGDGQERLGVVAVAYSLRFLEQQLAKLKRAKEAQYFATWRNTVMLGLVFIIIGTLLAVFQGMRIAKPIKLLAMRAAQIAAGNLETRVEVTSGDEIGLLGEKFNFMADQLVLLLQQTAEKATMEKELEVARTIQETLVPPTDIIEKSFIKLAGYFQPATQCGGDWWTVHELAGGKLLVVIGDVTGHGVPSAMITAAAKAACDSVRAFTNEEVTVTYLLEIMNRAIFEAAKRKFVMTCFASVIDPAAHTITFANAGHNFPYIYRKDETGKGQFGALMTRGNRLGDLQESKYQAKEMELRPDDVLVWYTDGIVECENEAGEEYGEKRFRAAIRRAEGKDPAHMRDDVVAAAQTFFGQRPRKDDITMVFARITSIAS